MIKKVVLAYSGGLDTSVILKWLKETYGCEVVAFCADLPGRGSEGGQGKGPAGGREQGVHRGSPGNLRPGLHLPHAARQRRVRRELPARHLYRPSSDCEAADRDRRTGRH